MRQGTPGPRPSALVLAGLVLASRVAAASPAPASVADADPGQPAPAVIAMDVRVSAIEIDLTLDPTQNLIRAIATLTLMGEDLSSLDFTLQEGLVVERSSYSAGLVEHRKAGDLLHVDLEPPLSGTHSLRFEISGQPLRGGKEAVGMDLAVLGPEDAWYPRLEATWATTRVTVHAPEGWTAVAPGVRDARAPQGAWRWRSGKPVRGIAVAAAADLKLTEEIAVQIPIRVAAPGGGPDAKTVASRVADSLAWFSAALTPYPFDGFNLVMLPGCRGRVQAGGMLVVPLETPIRTASDGADLLAGQWFGERLAGDGAWMEAFAAWEATVFARDRAIPPPAETERLVKGYFAMYGARDAPLAQAGADTPREVVRGKGSAAPDMIRLAVGDRRFFEAVAELFHGPIGPPTTLARMRAVFEKHAGKTLLRPFSDWFERSGAPDFEASLRTFPASDGGFRADLTLRQRRGLYALPVEVVFLGPGREHREVIEVEDEFAKPFFVLDFEPVRVEVDPGRKIFRWGLFPEAP